MVRPTHIVETCGGGLSVSLNAGWKARAPLAYWGGKTGFLHALLPAMHLDPGIGADHYLGIEPGPYGEFWQVVKDTKERRRLIEWLREQAENDPASVWENYAAAPVPEDPFERVAVWSVLQFWGYGRKLIYPYLGVKNVSQLGLFGTHSRHVRRWKHHGMDRTAPYNREYRERRGEGVGRRNVRLPDLVERLEALPDLSSLTVITSSALEVDPQLWGGPGVIVLIDPPYAGTEGYGPFEMSRADVIRLALAWAATGARVVVCEAEPILELVTAGWEKVELTAYLKGRGRTNGCREWLTLNFPPGTLPPLPRGRA